MKKTIKYLLGMAVIALLPFTAKAADLGGDNRINCPTSVFAGDIIECIITGPANSDITYTGISAKYDLPEGITYDSFTTVQEYSVNTNTENGFVLGNTAGLPSGSLATIKFKLADDLETGSSLTINLTDVNFTDTEYNDYDAEAVGFTYSTTITIIEDILEIDSSLNIENNLIYNLPLGHTIGDFLELVISNGTIVFYRDNIDGSYSISGLPSNIPENIPSDAYERMLVTGHKVKIELHKSTVEYTLSVRGDITGDGEVKMSDVMKAATHILDDTTITGDAYLKAGDVTGDGSIKMSDVMKMATYILDGGEL